MSHNTIISFGSRTLFDVSTKKLLFDREVFTVEKSTLLFLKLKLYLRLGNLFSYLDLKGIEALEIVLRREVQNIERLYGEELGFNFVDRRKCTIPFSDLSEYLTVFSSKKNVQSAERMWRSNTILKTLLLELCNVKVVEGFFPHS